MSEMPSEQVMSWAADAVGAGAKVVAVRSLHGGSTPWLLRIEYAGSTREAVLRVAGRVNPFQIATGAAALRVAEEHGLSAPRLIASDLDGRATGALATLETVVPGSSTSPAKVSDERLRTAGAAIAKVHKIPLEPQPELPLKVRSLQGPIQDDELALVRRWATLYRASSDSEKPAVVEALCELTGWSADHARLVMLSTHSTPLVAALMHALAAPDHVEEWWGYGTFMTAAVIAQAGFAVVMLWPSARRALKRIAAAGIVGNAAIIALYIITRTMGVPPIGPEAGEVEPVGEMGGIDVISTSPIGLVVTLIALLRVWSREVQIPDDDADATHALAGIDAKGSGNYTSERRRNENETDST